jgi:MYXO-CTERM domain-containing protein
VSAPAPEAAAPPPAEKSKCDCAYVAPQGSFAGLFALLGLTAFGAVRRRRQG